MPTLQCDDDDHEQRFPKRPHSLREPQTDQGRLRFRLVHDPPPVPRSVTYTGRVRRLIYGWRTMSRRDQVPRLTMTAWLRFDAIRCALSTTHPRTVVEFGAGQGGLGAWIARSRMYVGVEPDAMSRAV